LPALLDTDVVIHLRDGDPWIEDQVASLIPPFFISAISRVELENGIGRTPGKMRRSLSDKVLAYVVTLDFGAAEIEAYTAIIWSAGYSRRKTADRMTAATALTQGLPLVTLNGRDFRDVPGLELVEWERPEE
jgi:predicted nucleic acid-binding protein